MVYVCLVGRERGRGSKERGRRWRFKRSMRERSREVWERVESLKEEMRLKNGTSEG